MCGDVLLMKTYPSGAKESMWSFQRRTFCGTGCRDRATKEAFTVVADDELAPDYVPGKEWIRKPWR